LIPHVVLLGPDLFAAFHDHARALKRRGVRVTGVGSSGKERLRAGLRRHLDEWIRVPDPFDGVAVARAISGTGRPAPDRLETLDERLVEAAAIAREGLGLPGLSVRSARLCRDKPAMKDALRAAGLPCAESGAVASLGELETFAERVGYPLIVKPRAGLGSLSTHRVENRSELERAAKALRVNRGESVAVEEFVEGHEGFWDTLSVDGSPRLEFVSHYYPPVLAALSDRRVSPQIAATNRVELPSYSELRETGRRVLRALDIGTGATHMEWFFGERGLKISEIGARPPGERIWDLYCVGNDLDLYDAWAAAIATGRVEQRPSRRFATGSVQVRPEREGVVDRVDGVERIARRCGGAIWQHEVPRRGRRTAPLEKGYLTNAWFRLRHPDYDQLCRMMDEIGRTVRIRVR